jgi:Na+/melibiose symporter-like transporter
MTLPVPDPTVRQLRTIAGAVTAVPVLLGIVIFVVQNSDDGRGEVSWVAIGASLVVAAIAWLLCEQIGYRLRALPAARVDEGLRKQALQRFQASMMIRMALAEVPALVALALTFVKSPVNVFNYLPGGLAALALMALHVQPTRTSVARSETALDRDGGRSDLSRTFGY